MRLPMRPPAVPLLSGTLALAVVLAGCASPSDVGPAADAATFGAAGDAMVVLAHIDTGINPYARAFRDDGPLAQAHPSTYLPGFPADALALQLSLDEADWQTAREKDDAVWDAVERDTLYWIPGTRIVGAISFGAGGTNCPPGSTPPLTYLSGDCPEHVILDDHGHGTMTASRAAASEHSLCPTCRIVTIEGTGGDAVRWAADQGWIDVQTNSWLGFVPPPLDQRTDRIGPAFAYAAERMVTIAASGNGAGYILGFAPTPTYALDTAAPGVILVGAHDNGHVAAWSGTPAHVLADGFAGYTALRDSIDALEPNPLACCTSAAAPYAAGGAAAIILEARRILGDSGVGLRDGQLAKGEPSFAYDALMDGGLTINELRDLILKTANARPEEGPDDGAIHWGGRPAPPAATDPAGNPYCLGCWTSPVPYADVPGGAPLVALAGYGSVDPTSVALAVSVLHGKAPLPQRLVEDAFFLADAVARAVVFDDDQP